MASKVDKIVCAWGNNTVTSEPPVKIFRSMGLGNKLHYLRMSKQNQPWHPLYLPSQLTPIKYA